MWKLVIEDDEGKQTVVPLTREQYAIGRKEGNTIRLTERNVSREHARIYKKAPNGAGDSNGKLAYVLEDLTSYNGVFVNGLRITHAQGLAHGDLLQIGDYRIILQDGELSDTVIDDASNELKATVPNAPSARAAQLMDRPNRMVMLAGPTPGAEFPLDRERMTIGRAEDANISVNHNSVSRLHCEVHALGDGRFEIVDKGSSNGVRVNGADLRRGIVEPGDLIELGDVRFKFVGAGQIFRATESQQLAVLADRIPHDAGRGRGVASVLPFAIFAVVIAAGAAGAWVYTRPATDVAMTGPPASGQREQDVLDDARKLCASGDCDAAHEKLGELPESAPARRSAEFREIENWWADQVIAHADVESDVGRRRTMYQRVSQAITVERGLRKAAADRLQQLDMPAAAVHPSASQGPTSPSPSSEEAAVASASAARPEVKHPSTPPSQTAPATTVPVSVSTSQPAVSGTPKPSGSNVDDRERQLALQATPEAKSTLKQQLEQRVYGGRASDAEVRLLIATCKDLGDKLCVQQARAVQSQRQGQ